MKITNKHHLPLPLVALVSKPFYYTENRYGSTTLIMPPRILQLRKRYDDDLEEDASDRIWLLLGTKIHKDLEEAGIKMQDESTSWGDWIVGKARELLAGMLVEKKYEIDVNGTTVVCVGDIYIKALHELDDYKITSIWSVIDGKPKPDWEQQLNINAYIYRQHLHPVANCYVIAILRDWSAGQAQQGGNYPQVGVRKVTIPVWNDTQARAFIEDRVNLHRAAEELPDDDLPECSAIERFARPDQWAVRKQGNKRATKLFLRKEEAHDYIAQKSLEKDHVVDYRPGESVRCEKYCPVVKFCNQAKRLGVAAAN